MQMRVMSVFVHNFLTDLIFRGVNAILRIFDVVFAEGAVRHGQASDVCNSNKISNNNNQIIGPSSDGLGQGVNFINVLQTAFTQADPKCTKKSSILITLRFWDNVRKSCSCNVDKIDGSVSILSTF